MQTSLVDTFERPLTVKPVPLEVVISDEGIDPITIVLDPLEDIHAMQALKNAHFSLKESTAHIWREHEEFFQERLRNLETKRLRFEKSSIYFNRLANLAEMAGLRDEENKFLKEAKTLSDHNFIDHRIGDNLLASNNLPEAESFFSNLDLKSDVYANLRMSFFCIQRHQLDKAKNFVDQALNIDIQHYGARMIEGAIAIVQGHYEQAIRSFRIAEVERPRSSLIHMNMAVAYIYLHRSSKALKELRLAVALDPLNISAVTLLADLCFLEKCDEDAIPSMRFFLQFEQKNPEMWARFARAMLRIGESSVAIDALKRQGSIEDVDTVWNNLGVAYMQQKNFSKAYESLAYAMKMDLSKKGVYLLAARNIAMLLLDSNKYKDIIRFTSPILLEDSAEVALKDKILSDIWACHIYSLRAQGLKEQSVTISEKLIYRPNISLRLLIWLISMLLPQYTLTNNRSKALDLASKFEYLVEDSNSENEDRRDSLLNNIAFVYAEEGLFEKAESFLQRISKRIHKDPYPTATLGLINIRKGNVLRGENLYEEAIHLAHNKIDKTRIRQKVNYELARLYLNDDVSKANRYLKKVIAKPEGSPELVLLAKQLLKS